MSYFIFWYLTNIFILQYKWHHRVIYLQSDSVICLITFCITSLCTSSFDRCWFWWIVRPRYVQLNDFPYSIPVLYFFFPQIHSTSCYCWIVVTLSSQITFMKCHHFLSPGNLSSQFLFIRNFLIWRISFDGFYLILYFLLFSSWMWCLKFWIFKTKNIYF